MYPGVCARARGSARGGDSREILAELRKIDEHLAKINDHLERFDPESRARPPGSDGERIFQELNRILRQQQNRPQMYDRGDRIGEFR